MEEKDRHAFAFVDEVNGVISIDEHPAVEIWETQRNALPLVESIFGRLVRLDSMAAPTD